MKKNFLRRLLMFTKFSLYGFLLQTMVMTTLFAMNSNAQVKSVKDVFVNLQLKDAHLGEVLKQIEFQTNFMFVYAPGEINDKTTVNINARNKRVSDVLMELSKKTQVKFKQVNQNISIQKLQPQEDVSPVEIVLQGFTVTGRVTEGDEALPGVNVLVKGTSEGTVTDIDGRYSIVAPSDNTTLIFSFVGYTTEEININNRSVINVSLTQDVKSLEEIVVIGYGAQQKSLVTGSISSVKASDIENTSISRAEQVLQGRTAGIQVLPTSGSPGAGMKVRVRGAGSTGNSNPLFIVDGIKASDINYLAPEDIESMEVLKDGAASAIYGAEGGSGVVIITTKSGKEGPGVLNYTFQYGTQSVGNLPDMMNAAQYSQYMAEAGRPTVGNANTNWLEELFETAPMQKHHLSFTAGSQATSMFTSLTYLNQDGVVGGDKAKFERITGRINIDHQLKPWIKIGSNISYSNTRRAAINEDSEFGGVLSSALMIDPLTPTHTSTIPTHIQEMIDANELNPALFRKDSDGRYFGNSGNIQGEAINPFLSLFITEGNTQSDRIFGSFYSELELIDDLKFTSRLGIDYEHSNNHFWTPTYYYSAERQNTSTGVTDNTFTQSKWQWENFFTYTKTIGNNNIGLVAGMSAEQLQYRFLNANTTGMFVESGLFDQHEYTASTTGNIRGNLFEEKLASYFGRVTYDYNNKYMINATLRADGAGTSLLSPDNNWGIFPSISAGWVISEENFFPNGGFLSFAKLRASWGQNGSLANLRNVWTDYNDFSPFSEIEGRQFNYLSSITSQGIRYPLPGGGYIVGAEPAVLANPDLTWETSEQTNFGLDLEAMNGSLIFSVEYYNKITRDLLAYFAAPATAGNKPPFFNAGDVKNSGLEFNFGIRKQSGDFKYAINANLATQNNEVTALRANVPRIAGMRVGVDWREATSFEVGEPIWYFRGYQTAGIFKDQSDIDKYISDNQLTGYSPVPGDAKLVDINGDKRITPADQGKIGNPHPSMIYGGGVNLSYKGIDFNVFAQGVSGNDILMGYIRTDRPTGNKPAYFFENRWKPEGGNDNATMPRAEADIRAYRSDLMVQKGSYMRIKQIQLGYTLPSSLVSNIGINNARIYVSLDDYFTFTKYKGMDPEAGSPEDASLGIDRGVYPLPRKMLFGLSVNF